MSKQISFRILIITLALFIISGCSTYPNRFKCGDARGLGCTMLHEVDLQIDSGQIEEAYKDKKCRGKNCSPQLTTEILKLKKQDKADNYFDEPEESLGNDHNLYF